MIIRVLGADLLTLLMSVDRASEADMSWLLYGPTDERVVERASPSEDDAEPLRWAAE